MRYKFEIIGAYPKRRFAVYEKKESFFDKVKRILGWKKKEKKKSEIKKTEGEGERK
ncbi:MAG: hypothetical protein QXY05_03890 [Candidatus Anstonellales archaeon]